MKKDFIPLALPDLSGKEKDYVLDALDSTWISSKGKYIEKFEKIFARKCGVNYAVSICNGTAALHTALLALGIGSGDEVIVPSLTYIATANAVTYTGAVPVFVDADIDTWCIDPEKIESEISERTKAIIPVHLYGHPADMDKINRIAAKYNLYVVEDAAEAPFGEYKGEKVGSLGDVAAFSLFGNKIFTAGEGGVLTFKKRDIAERAFLIKCQGVDPHKAYFFPEVGYNYRMTNIACAIAYAQIERADEILKRRNNIYNIYNDILSSIEGITIQKQASWAKVSPWLYSVIIDELKYGKTRDQLIAFLHKNNVETRPFFIPLHLLPPYADNMKYDQNSLCVSERIGKTGINLPTYNTLSELNINRICDLIKLYHSA